MPPHISIILRYKNFIKEVYSRNTISEILEEMSYDNLGKYTKTRIHCVVYYRYYAINKIWTANIQLNGMLLYFYWFYQLCIGRKEPSWSYESILIMWFQREW